MNEKFNYITTTLFSKNPFACPNNLAIKISPTKSTSEKCIYIAENHVDMCEQKSGKNVTGINLYIYIASPFVLPREGMTNTQSATRCTPSFSYFGI